MDEGAGRGPGAGLTDDDVAREITSLGAHVAAATSRLLDLLAIADERGIWQDWDAKSLAQFASWLTGMSPHRSRLHAEVATKILQWPETKKALARGTISFCQAASITSTDAPGFDQDLVNIACSASSAQLQRVTRSYRRALAIGGFENGAHRRTYLDYFYDDDGFVIRGRLERDDGAVVKTALDAAADALFRRRSEEDTSDDEELRVLERDERNAAALVAVARDSLAATTATSGGDCHQVVVHVDAATFAGATDDDAEIEGAGAVDADTARRIACDASIVALLKDGDRMLSAGRRSRRPSRAIRRALRARDKMCRFPGCANNRYLDHHHMRPVVDNGETSVDNLVLVCSWHHKLLHKRRYRVALDEGGVPLFTRPDGTRVQSVAARPTASPTDVINGNRARGVDVHRPPAVPEDAGRRIDWVEAIHTIFFQPANRPQLPPDVRKHCDRTDPPPGGG
ncbi:MAG: DUF222 domain-containing protein [Actinomycetota bacterium]